MLLLEDSAMTTRIADIMTRSVAAVGRDETLQAAARRMREMDVGALPVTDGRALAGMVTDRDITVLGADRQIVGIVALADLATRQSAPTDETLREISTPDL
jgi:CBS-domain-containing membrane protein